MNRRRKKPPDLAVALHYDQQNAPRISAKGAGELANSIIALAQQHGIPLHDDPELVAILAQIPLGDEIPENLYVAVAEVIAFAYLITGKRPPGFQEPDPVGDL
jgi:flagellar biosynthesis protein